MSDVAKAKKGRMDAFANVAFGTCTQSAANTLTFAAIQMAVGMFQGIAMLINRVKYIPTAPTLREIVAAADRLDVALTSSNRLTAITDVTDPAILDYQGIIGIGVNLEPRFIPMISDYSQMPGGGKLISSNPLYLGVSSAGFGAAGVVRVQIDFTFVELSDKDYLELIQAQFPTNIS
jgi:hypothetical protein